MDEENKLRLGELVISLGRDHGMSETEVDEAHGLWSLARPLVGRLFWVADADDNRPQPRRFSRNPRRESGYERDDSYVGMTDSDIARSRWAGVDAEIHGYEEPGDERREFLVMGKNGFPLHGFRNREDAETFVRDNADAAEIVEIPVT